MDIVIPLRLHVVSIIPINKSRTARRSSDVHSGINNTVLLSRSFIISADVVIRGERNPQRRRRHFMYFLLGTSVRPLRTGIFHGWRHIKQNHLRLANEGRIYGVVYWSYRRIYTPSIIITDRFWLSDSARIL